MLFVVQAAPPRQRGTLGRIRRSTTRSVTLSSRIGHIESSYGNEAEKNEFCTPKPFPNTDVDWLRTELTHLVNTARWSADEALTAWIRSSRLDIIHHTGAAPDPTPAQRELVGRIRELTPPAIENLQRLLDEGERGDVQASRSGATPRP